MKEVKIRMGRMGVRFLEVGVEERVEIPWRHVFVDLVLCGGSEKDVKIMMGRFIEVCRRQGLKINSDKNEVIVVGG